MKWQTNLARILAFIGAGWTVGIGFWRWLTPVAWHTGMGIDGAHGEAIVYRSFSEGSPLGPLPLLFPAGIAAIAAWAAWHGRRTTQAAMLLLLSVFTVLAGFSIGFYYVPAAAALALATAIPSAGRASTPAD